MLTGWTRAGLVVSVVCAVVGLVAIPAGAGADNLGSMAGVPLKEPIVGITPTPSGEGYWLVASDGGIFSFGDAEFHGSTGALVLNEPILGMAATGTGEGYWLVASDGGIFSFGDAEFYGSTGDQQLPGSIIGMAATHTGDGYWLAGSDGTVYPFGDAYDHGHMGDVELKEPVVGLSAPAYGTGYWLVASDGGIFSFGDAEFYGSTGALTLTEPITAMVAHPHGFGYWLVAADGGVFSFGSTAGFYGSTGGMQLDGPVVGAAASLDGFGYWMAGTDGAVYAFGDAEPIPRGDLGLTPRRTASDSAPLRVMTLGDSVMISLQDGLDIALRDTGQAFVVKRGKWAYGLTAGWKPTEPCIICNAVPEYAPESLSKHARYDNFDALVLMVGGWDIFGRHVDGEVLAPFSSAWQQWYRALQDDAVERLTSRGGVVAWVGYPGCEGTNQDDVEFNAYAAEAAARYSDKVVYLDLQARVCPDGPQVPLELSNGVPVDLLDETGHFTAAGARWVGDWITAELRSTFKLPKS